MENTASISLFDTARSKMSCREEVISDGYGDFIARMPAGEDIDPSTWEKVSALFATFHPATWALAHKKASPEERIRQIKEEIHRIDDKLEVTFIPRTLYEVVFLCEAIKEDLREEEKFSYKDPERPTEDELWAMHESLREKNSWLKRYSSNQESILAYSLNRVFNEIFREHGVAIDLTMEQIESILEERIAFLKGVYSDESSLSTDRIQQIRRLSLGMYPECLTPRFVRDDDDYQRRQCIMPLAISNSAIADILRNSIRLECSRELGGKIILYRGASLDQDFLERDTTEKIRSLSFGTSLFAGCVKDPGATAFFYMRQKQNDAFAAVIDPGNPEDSCFSCPVLHTIESLFSGGEYFHSRSKVPLLDPDETVDGFFGSLRKQYSTIQAELKSPYTKEEFLRLFRGLKEQVFVFKKAMTE
ncbi:MAG: hypothetical protein HY860_05970 [Chlamydiales bacterium]|nr:hypothetical protein [Chlamydiales bacterium]